jgi:hypothetical protein
MVPKTTNAGSSRRTTRSKVAYKEVTDDDTASSTSVSTSGSDEYQEDEEHVERDREDEDVSSLDSEDLDATPKRKRVAAGRPSSSNKRVKATSVGKNGLSKRPRVEKDDEEGEQSEEEVELEEGQTVAGE